MNDGIIELGTEAADELGFTEDLFYGYLWKDGNEIIISVIGSHHQGQGNIRRLFDTIESKGYTVVVPTPSNRMRYICSMRGMSESFRGEYEVMIKQDKP